MTEDRNLLERHATDLERISWRSPHAVTEDRNHGVGCGQGCGGQGWRSPHAVTEDRNGFAVPNRAYEMPGGRRTR